MALSGVPAITDPRTQDRATQQAISNIRQRIEAIESVVNSNTTVANAGLTNQSASNASINALAAAVSLLQSQVAALQTGTQFYLDGVFVGSERKVNLHSGHDILVTLLDNPGLSQVDIWFTIPVYAAPAGGAVSLTGWDPAVVVDSTVAVPDGALAITGWDPTRIP